MEVATLHDKLSVDDLLKIIRSQNAEINFLRDDISRLEELNRLLTRQRFAPKSEIYASGQGTLFNESEVLAATADKNPEDKPAGKSGKSDRNRVTPKRAPLPKELERRRNVIDLPDAAKYCAHGILKTLVREEIFEQLGIDPAKLFVIETVRPVYSSCNCPQCVINAKSPNAEGIQEPLISIAPMEPQAIPESVASASLLAHIAIGKYGDALPLYRQEGILARYGIDLSRATMGSWMIGCGELVMPLIELAKTKLLSAPVIYSDETRMQILKGTGKAATAKSYTWVFMSECEKGPKIIIYQVGPSRGHEVPQKFLDGYKGFLHTDGYESYETLASKMPTITLVGDWVHVRRKFDEAVKAVAKDFKGEVKARVALELINELFRIEREMGEVTPDEKLRIRQEKSKPVIDALKNWADEAGPCIPPKSLIGKAITYMLQRWGKLILFLDNVILRLDTNPVENAIRPFVIGRKNWLFSATVDGAKASAALYSLITMARANGVEPYSYLEAVFRELPKAESSEQKEALLPWNW